MNKGESTSRRLKIAVIGGSLSALMNAVAMKQAGHVVTVIEKEGDERESHMAGVCLGLDAVEYLARHDRLKEDFSHRSLRIQALDDDDNVRIFVKGRRDITNWDTLYYRLRSNFDGYVTATYPRPAPVKLTDGEAVYRPNTQVLDIARNAQAVEEAPQMVLTVLDRSTGAKGHMEADMVIAADGPDSAVRAKYLPGIKRRYVGFIAWRGTVPESELPDAVRFLFRRSVTVYMMRRQHCIVYTIPGINGSLAEGEKYVNFLWYTNETPDSLHEIMKDGLDGHVHTNIVPAGRVRQDIWAERIRLAQEMPLAPPFLSVLMKIRRPFIQVITDFCSPKAAFEDGKVLLVGDALSLFRPHTAFSGTQAAFHALRTADLVHGRMTIREWEEKVLRFSWLHYRQSNWYGDFYQYHVSTALAAAVRYWVLCGHDKMLSWYNGEDSLLRTSTLRAEAYEDEADQSLSRSQS